MRLIVTESIEHKARSIGISFDDIYDFIKIHRNFGLEQLCSPLPDTIAYKGYMSRGERIVVFAITYKGIIYPVYIGDKHDIIAKNITVQAVRKFTETWQKKIEQDIIAKKIKIRHF